MISLEAVDAVDAASYFAISFNNTPNHNKVF
jgi:hypothetical protein